MKHQRQYVGRNLHQLMDINILLPQYLNSLISINYYMVMPLWMPEVNIIYLFHPFGTNVYRKHPSFLIPSFYNSILLVQCTYSAKYT
jgi:hypothetical protein